MGIESLSDISRGGNSAFAAGGGGGVTNVTDANAATSTGRYNLLTPFTNSPNTGPGAINVTEENGRITQKGYFWYSAFSIVQESTRYFNGTAWTAWWTDVKAGTSPNFNNTAGKTITTSVSGTFDIDPLAASHRVVTMTADTTFAFNNFWLSNDSNLELTMQLSGAFQPSFTGVTWVGGVAPVYASGMTYSFITRKDSGGTSSVLGWPASTPASTQTVSSAAGVLNLSTTTAETVLVTLTENITSITLPIGVAGGRRDLIIQFAQDATGGRTVAGWPSSATLQWQGGIAATVASSALAVTQVAMSNANNTVWIGYNTPSSGLQPIARIPTTQRIVAGAIAATALSTIAMTAARIQFIPFVPPRRMRITSLGFSVSTLLAGTATMGIYAANGNASFDYPGTLLASTTQGALDTTTTGTKTAACAYVLEPGVLYFIAVICSAACTLRGVPLASQDCMLGWTDNSTTNISSYYNAGATNVLPANAAAPTVNAGVVIPALYLIEG